MFIKNENLDPCVLHDSLFISFDKYSALRADYWEVVSKLKKNESFKIIKRKESILSEGYSQGLFIIQIDSLFYFIRLIIADEKLYDVLVYTIDDMDLILRVFFTNSEESIPIELEELINQEQAALIIKKIGKQYRLIKANSFFYKLIGYEDWDFANKYENNLNEIIEIISSSKIEFIRSDGKIIEFEFNRIEKNDFIFLEHTSKSKTNE